MGAATAEEMKKHVRVYIAVFAALAFLTIVTVMASHVEVSMGAHIAIALIIAAVKGTLVACYFMHLISERWTLYGILIICVLFFAALLVVPGLTNVESVAVPSDVT